jgi:bacterioferritin (cytochrome b1)
MMTTVRAQELPAPGECAFLSAIDSCREMIGFTGQHDPTSRRLLETIPAQEEEHVEALVDLLEDLPKD